MGLRDLALIIVFFGALPLIPFRPFVGLLMFSWLAYLRPQDLSWAFKASSFSQYAALAMMLGLAFGFLFPSVVPREKLATFRIQTAWMIALWVWVWICSQTALNPRLAAGRLDLFTTVMVIAVLTTGMVRSSERFRLMILVIAFSLGALGLKYALFGVLRGGTSFSKGPGGFMHDNNSFALCLNMALPLLAGVFFVDKSKPLRFLALVLALGSVLTIAFTFSRGGLLTLAVVSALLVWTSGRRVLSAGLLVLAVGGFFAISGDGFKQNFFDRAESIKTYEEDSSAMGRIDAWATAGRVAEDYPFLGVGPNNFRVVYWDYSDRDVFKVTHNSFFQFLVDVGYPGLALLVGLLVLSLYRLQKTRARHKEEWVRTYARMLQISILAFIVGGSLLDMAYLDLLYHLLALGVCLEVAAEGSLAAATGEEAVPSAPKPWYLVAPARSRASGR